MLLRIAAHLKLFKLYTFLLPMFRMNVSIDRCYRHYTYPTFHDPLLSVHLWVLFNFSALLKYLFKCDSYTHCYQVHKENFFIICLRTHKTRNFNEKYEFFVCDQIRYSTTQSRASKNYLH